MKRFIVLALVVSSHWDDRTASMALDRLSVDPPVDTAAYTVRDPAAVVYVRNPLFYLGSVRGLEAISPARLVEPPDVPYQACCVAVTPRHVYAATHNLSLHPGTRVVFVTAVSEAVVRTVVATTNAWDDVSFALLDEDLPASVPPARLFTGVCSNLLAAGFNQDDHAGAFALTVPVFWSAKYFSAQPAPGLPSFTPRAGDSGKPVAVVEQGELLLVGGWTSPSSGTSLWAGRTNNDTALRWLSEANGAPVYKLRGYVAAPRNLRRL